VEPSPHRLGGAWSTPAYTRSTRVRALVVLEFPCFLFVTPPPSAREDFGSNSTLPQAFRKVYVSYPSTCHINAPHPTFHSIPSNVYTKKENLGMHAWPRKMQQISAFPISCASARWRMVRTCYENAGHTCSIGVRAVR
jgi:hypothetical protein